MEGLLPNLPWELIEEIITFYNLMTVQDAIEGYDNYLSHSIIDHIYLFQFHGSKNDFFFRWFYLYHIDYNSFFDQWFEKSANSISSLSEKLTFLRFSTGNRDYLDVVNDKERLKPLLFFFIERIRAYLVRKIQLQPIKYHSDSFEREHYLNIIFRLIERDYSEKYSQFNLPRLKEKIYSFFPQQSQREQKIRKRIRSNFFVTIVGQSFFDHFFVERSVNFLSFDQSSKVKFNSIQSSTIHGSPFVVSQIIDYYKCRDSASLQKIILSEQSEFPNFLYSSCKKIVKIFSSQNFSEEKANRIINSLRLVFSSCSEQTLFSILNWKNKSGITVGQFITDQSLGTGTQSFYFSQLQEVISEVRLKSAKGI